MRDARTERKMDEAQDKLYPVEHTMAWVMAIIGFGLSVFGTLVGLGVIELREGAALLNPAGFTGDETLLSNHFWDAAMLLFSGMTAGVMAFCFHNTDHHRMRDLSTLPDSERSVWGAEHAMAYLIGVGAIVYVIIGLLVGFNAFSATHDQGDGLIWIWFGLGASLVATALHSVRHHQVGVEEAAIAHAIEIRLAARPDLGTTGTTGATPRVSPQNR